MSSYRLIQISLINNDGKFIDEFRIQKNYGKFLIKDWIDVFGEVYQTKNDGLIALDNIKKNKGIKSISKTIKVIK